MLSVPDGPHGETKGKNQSDLGDSPCEMLTHMHYSDSSRDVVKRTA